MTSVTLAGDVIQLMIHGTLVMYLLVTAPGMNQEDMQHQ